MDLEFKEQGDGRYQIVRGKDPVGVVVPQADGGYGYSLFGTPHMGQEKSLEAVEKAVHRYLD